LLINLVNAVLFTKKMNQKIELINELDNELINELDNELINELDNELINELDNELN